MNPSETQTTQTTTPLPSFIVSVDTVVFEYRERQVYIPLLMRGVEPYIDSWSLPGGPILEQETPEAACLRKLEADIGLSVNHIEQLYTFGRPDRDPRKRAFSISYFALIAATDRTLTWGADSRNAQWFPVDNLPSGPWAFDHEEIVAKAIQRLQSKLRYEPVGLSLLPEEFSLSELKMIYDAILGREVDRRNFYKKIKASGMLTPTRIQSSGGRGKPSQLYRFDRSKYESLKQEGYAFGF